MADPVLHYPDTPANITARAIRATVWPRRALPTPPPLTLAGATAQAQRDGLAATAALTPVESLEIYPQTINAEYLTPMNTLIAAGDQDAIDRYGIWINPQVGDELMRRNAAADLTPPVPDTVEGVAVVASAVADGAAAASAKFTVLDQDRVPMKGAAVTFSSGSETATLTPASGTTGTDGGLTVSVKDTAVETVTVTATSGGKTDTVDLGFTAP